jgi:PAS domain S-box-containing protein
MLSTHALMLLATGVTLYAGIFHGAFARHLPASRWLAGWAISATGFLLARTAQVATTDPELAIFWSRVYAAISPFMMLLLVRSIGELSGVSLAAPLRAVLSALATVTSGLALGSSWIIMDRVSPRLDLFGAWYLSAHGGPGLVLLMLGTFATLAWSIHALSRSERLAVGERRALVVALGVYGLLAIESLLSSARLIATPGLVEFAPLCFVIATSQLSANRESRLQRELELSIDVQDAKLRTSEERYRNLVEHAPLGIVVCDQSGRVLTLNQRFRTTMGFDEAGGVVPANLITDGPPSVASSVQRLVRALATGEEASGDVPYTTASGRRVDMRVVIAPQRNAAGEPDGALILAEDVTGQRVAQERLRQSLKLEAIGQLTGGIATGVTTPMAEVRENLAALANGCDALRKQLPRTGDEAERFAEIEELLSESREGVERAIAIVRDMRELAHGGSVARERVELGELLASVVRMVQAQRPSGVVIVERYRPAPRVLGNAGQLRQVFLNLLVNAVQAVGASGRVELVLDSERGGACVRVRDDGPGIAPEHRERIFVPFFTTKPAGEGTGLGLYISYQIVQGHGGEVRVDSVPGAGATFQVWLPSEPAARGTRA